MLDEIDLYLNFKINHNLTESDIDKINVSFQLEHQSQTQEMKNSDWRFDEIFLMTIYFYKTTEMNGSSCVRMQLRSSAVLIIEKDDK